MAYRLGIVGMGAAARALVPALEKRSDMHLAAICEPVDEVRERSATRYDVPMVATIDDLLARTDVDAVYIATPTDLHAAHVVAAARAGKHVLVEKPMATTLDEATAMIDAAERAGSVLTVGHSHSFDEPYRAMRELIAGGTLGRARQLHNIYYSDWVYRPRRPDELDERLGGGITFRQGAHQFDILRLLGGGLVKSVRAQTFDWDPDRPVIGAHSVFLTFEDGAVATAIYNGYGAFPSAEITFGAGEIGYPYTAAPGAARAAMQSGIDEAAAKRSRNSAPADTERAPYQPFFGWTLVSCERGDIRQSATGLYVYTVRGREELPLRLDRTTREPVLDEFVGAIAGVRPSLHDGRWGRANLEVCVATIASSQSGREVELAHQVPVDHAPSHMKSAAITGAE
jgi:phthalate 4,5-cis-dihydrodiol dehydrogenase